MKIVATNVCHFGKMFGAHISYIILSNIFSIDGVYVDAHLGHDIHSVNVWTTQSAARSIPSHLQLMRRMEKLFW